MRSLALLSLFATACSSSPEASPRFSTGSPGIIEGSGPSSPPVQGSAGVRPEDPSRIAVQKQGDASASSPPGFPTTLDEAAASAFAGQVPAACEGTSIDLANFDACRCELLLHEEHEGRRVVRMGMWCGAAFDAETLPPGVEVNLVPDVSEVRGGAEVGLVLRARNRSAQRVAMRLRGEGHIDVSTFGLRVIDARDNDVTTTHACFGGRSMGHDDHLVILAPGGEARFRFKWRAVVYDEQMSGVCSVTESPLAVGSYRLRLRTPIVGATTVETSIEVRRDKP